MVLKVHYWLLSFVIVLGLVLPVTASAQGLNYQDVTVSQLDESTKTVTLKTKQNTIKLNYPDNLFNQLNVKPETHLVVSTNDSGFITAVKKFEKVSFWQKLKNSGLFNPKLLLMSLAPGLVVLLVVLWLLEH